MKKTYCLLFILIPAIAFSQKHKLGIGIKAGPTFTMVSNTTGISASNKTGFHAGLFLDFNPKIFGSRTEVLYLQQGYNYVSDSTKVEGSVRHSYIALAQLMSINITKYVQLQFGMQMGYMLNAKTDSSFSTGNATADNVLKLYNRFDYGLGGGLEVHPYAGIVIGARYNFSLSNLYKQYTSDYLGGDPSSGTNLKTRGLQVFVGYRF